MSTPRPTPGRRRRTSALPHGLLFSDRRRGLRVLVSSRRPITSRAERRILTALVGPRRARALLARISRARAAAKRIRRQHRAAARTAR